MNRVTAATRLIDFDQSLAIFDAQAVTVNWQA
jgi:hypothetical protein